MSRIIFDFSRTLYNPTEDRLESGTEEILQELSKKHNLFLLSKNPAGRRERAEELVGKYFRRMFFVEEKSLDGLKKIIEDEKLNAGDCWIVGDRARKEIAFGKELGMKTVWVKQGKFAEEEPLKGLEPDFTINNLNELAYIIAGGWSSE